MRVAALGAGEGRTDELAEQRRRPIGPALELRMGLRSDPERMLVQLDELHQPAVRRQARATEPVGLELGPVLVVELVAVAVTLGHHPLAVRLRDDRARRQFREVRAKAHRAALGGYVALALEQFDDRM